MYGVWAKQADAMQQAKNSKARSLCPGPCSTVLGPIQDELLRYIFELREQGMPVSISIVMMKAAQLSPAFSQKSRTAQYSAARRFVRTHGLVFRLGTRESQRSPTETAAEALDYMISVARPKVADQPSRHQDYILNMDQTPIPFTYNNNKTLEVVGRRTVHIRKSTNDTKRATFAMTVTASGKILKPLLVFKGTPNGRIVRNEFPGYTSDMVYACQGNAWMDEEVMMMWVSKVLQPYIATAPEGIVPILFLDSYRCHMMASVVARIQDLGVEVEHIPGGCTPLCQPVDIGVNKPFKDRIRRQWEAWMINEGTLSGTTSPPSRADIVQWTLNAANDLTQNIVFNSWRHGNYTWFRETAPPAAAAAAGN
ncbi:Pogo transposable element with KRAB domain [Fragilaria crotonensis]|nr:Pogo transposable element with KRAB domain [Fragilaria crotonensis]